jgi:uncharacterized protein YciI
MGARMSNKTRFTLISAMVCIGACLGPGRADPSQPSSPIDSRPLFAIEVRVGPKWDSSKAPHEQAMFREHSANLKRLRDAGSLIMGARYSNIGLIILAADSEASARAMIDADPSIAAGTFTYAIHPFSVFYSGTVRSPSSPPAAK